LGATKVAVLLLSTGCGADSAVPVHVVSDSAGVRIVRNGSLQSELPAWRLGAVVFHVPSEFGGESPLFRIKALLHLPTGEIAVANAGEHRILFFSREGSLVRVAGGRGRGPGEFGSLDSIGPFRADSIWAFDQALNRFSFLDVEGNIGRTLMLERFPGGALYHYAVGSLSDGSILTFVSERLPPNVEERVGLYRLRFILLKHDSSGNTVAELGRFNGFEGYLVRLPQGMLGNIGEAPFGRTTRFATHGSQIFAFTNDTYVLQRYDADGVLSLSIRRNHAPVSVTQPDSDAYREEWITGFGDEDDHAARQRLSTQIEYPAIMPAYGRAMQDRLGNTWIEDYRTPLHELARWTVFNSEGRMVAHVDIPTSFTVYDIGNDYVLGVDTNQLGEESITMHALEKVR
jgi:hypothetical protein